MKKNKWRSLLSIVLALTMVIGCTAALIGCQEKKSIEPSVSQKGGESSTSKEVPAKDKPYAGKTIKVLVVPHPATEPAKKFIPEFEAATGIKVDIEYLERVSLGTKQEMELGMHSGAYDVMHMDVSKASRYEAANWAEPLDDLIASKNPAITDPNLNVNDFVPAYIDLLKAKGKTLGLPFAGEVTILYYRKDLFEEAGIKDPPKTFDELETVAAKIKAKIKPDIAEVGLRARAGEGMNISFWSAFLWGYGGRYVDQNGIPVLNSPEAIKATEVYARLINQYGPAGGGDFTHYELYTAFQQGKLAMFYDASSLSSNFTDPNKSLVTDKWAAAPAPLGPSSESANMVYSHGLMIPKGCKNKEVAWQFIQWYTGKDLQKKISTVKDAAFSGIVRKSVIADPEYIAIHSKNNWLGAVNESLKHTRPDYRMYNNQDWPWIGDTVGKAVQDTIVGKGTAQGNMDKLNKDLIAFMKEKGYIK